MTFSERKRASHALSSGDAFMARGNTRPLVPEVMVRGTDCVIVRRRPTYEEMIAQESLPPWLSSRSEP